VVEKKRVFLSHASASDAPVLRATERVGKQAGVPLEIETLEAVPGD
jgi:hypothetical protein